MKNHVHGAPKHEEVWQKVTGFIQAAEEKCTEDRKTKELHAFGTCLWIKMHSSRFLREPLVAMLTLALLSLNGYAHFWHLTLDTLTAMGLMEEERICFAVFKKNSSQISQATWNHAREILDFSILKLCDDAASGVPHVWWCISGPEFSQDVPSLQAPDPFSNYEDDSIPVRVVISLNSPQLWKMNVQIPIKILRVLDCIYLHDIEA